MTRRFFIEKTDIHDQSALITGSDAKHIKNVLRLKPGDKIRLFDGSGIEYNGEIRNFPQGQVDILIEDQRHTATKESSLHMAVAQGFLKDRKMDILVRQLTELGVTEWIPFWAKRSIPIPDKKRLAGRIERWKKIAREALKQCQRGVLPAITAPLSFNALLQHAGQFDIKIIFWEKETQRIGTFAPPADHCVKSVLIALGPEGGFSDEEIRIAIDAGFMTASLGPRILRAETATIAACTLIQFLFGDIG